MDIKVVPVDKPEDMNVIIGQAHFIKTVEDLHEAIGAGVRTKGVEGPDGIAWRKDFLRRIGYTL